MKLTEKELQLLLSRDLLLRERAWRKGRLRWKLHAAQKHIYDTIRNLPVTIREPVILSSRRLGKSYLIVTMALEDCLRNKNVRVRIIGPDIKQTTNIVVPLITKITQDAPEGLIKRTKSENKWIVGDSELILGGFDSSNIESHRGSESYSIYIEETGSCSPDQYSYAMTDVLKPQLLHSRGRIVHATTPPPSMGHPFVVDTISQARVNNSFFQYTIYDNPLLDQDQIEDAIKDCGGVDTIAFRREYLCELIKDERLLVYPEFSPHCLSTHVPEHWKGTISIDFGGIRDKTVALLLTYDFIQGIDLVLDERVFDRNTDTRTIIETIREMEVAWGLKDPTRYADASGMTHVDANQLFGYHFAAPHKDDLDAAVNAVRIRLAQGKLKVNPKCKVLMQTLESQQYNDKRTDFLRTDALGHNDAGMALTYGIRMLDRITNPYPIVRHNRETTWAPKQQEPMEQLVSNLGWKSFGSFKR